MWVFLINFIFIMKHSMRKRDKLRNLALANKKVLRENAAPSSNPMGQAFAELANKYQVNTIGTYGESNPLTSELVYQLMDKNNYNADLLSYMDRCKQEEGRYPELEDNEISSKLMIGGVGFSIDNDFMAGNVPSEFLQELVSDFIPSMGGVDEEYDMKRNDYDYPEGDSYYDAAATDDAEINELEATPSTGGITHMEKFFIDDIPSHMNPRQAYEMLRKRFPDTRASYDDVQSLMIPNLGNRGLGESKKSKSLDVLSEGTQTMFEKLCGVKIIKESNDSSESKRKYDEVDAVMAKLGIALTTHGIATHGVSVNGEVRIFRSSYDEAKMIAQKLSSIIKDKSIKIVELGN